ncbi:MAG TPA: hypothetical protein VHD69_02450 [Candidatus Paceibacterota bacterium]|nr:hypothetical protein [Candidatus Paceibacterota bacterium]
MRSVIVLHNFGLGDHFMCHGIVRDYAARYAKVGLFCLPHNYASTAFMYRDLPNVAILKGDEKVARAYIAENAGPGREYGESMIIGFDRLDKNSGVHLQKQFYTMAGVGLDKTWSAFHVERDRAVERAFSEKNAPKKPYAFLHEDTSRGYAIKRHLVNRDLEVFVPDPSKAATVFDYTEIIEKAAEIHVIDSSFMFMIDCLPYRNPDQKLFVHRYARENNEWQLPILKKDWTIIGEQTNALDPLRRLVDWLAAHTSNNFLRRLYRKIFRIAGWTMGRPNKPDIKGFIDRYDHFGIEVYPDMLASDAKTREALKKIRPNVKNALMTRIDRKILSLKAAERMLAEAGYEVFERQIYSKEACFISRRS